MGRVPIPQTNALLRARLAVEVFGGLSLSVAGKQLPIANRKGRALLAYLALEAPGASRGLTCGNALEQLKRA